MKTLTRLFICVLVYLFSFNQLQAQDADKAREYYDNEQYELAAKEFVKVFEEVESQNVKDTSFAKICYFTAASFDNLDSINEAIFYYSHCNEVYKSIHDSVDKAYYSISLNNLARIYHYMGQFEEALPLFQEALIIKEKSMGNGDLEYGIGLYNLSYLYIDMGQYDKALPILLDALKIIEESLGKEHSDYGVCLNSLIYLYSLLGQYEKALPLAFESLENAEKSVGKEHPYYGTSLNNIACIYMSLGQPEKALPIYMDALENTEKALGKEHLDYTTSLNNLAELYYSKGQYEQALPLYLESLAIAKIVLGNDHPGYAVRMQNLALLYGSMGQYEKALPLYIEALKITERSLGKNHSFYGKNLYNLAKLYFAMGDYKEALTLYVEGMGIMNYNIIQNFAFLSENEKELYLKTVDYKYEIFNSYALQYKNMASNITSEVFNNTLTNKGMLLKSSTAMRAAVLSSGDTALIRKFDEWTALNKQIASLYSTEKSKRIQDPIELEEKATLIERELVRSSQEFSDYKNLQNTKWQDIQKSLQEDEAAIEFISFRFYDQDWTDSTLYCALIIKPESEYPEMIELFEKKELESYISNTSDYPDAGLIAMLYGSERGIGAVSTYGEVSYSDSIYSLIWKPLEDQLQNTKRVYYSPAGLLHTISFSAISDSNSKLLSDKFDLIYVSSTANIANPVNDNIDFASANVALYGGLQYDITTDELLAGSNLYKQTNNDDLLAYNRSYTLADSSRGASWGYLKGTFLEVENIDKRLKNKQVATTLYQGFEGNEESFKSLAGNNSPEIIHLATHGFFFPDPDRDKDDKMDLISKDKMVFKDSDNPLIRSGIILSGANLAWKGEEIPEGVDDGILTAYEVSGMDLFNTQLVVLSACETGLGDIKGSEGVYGLQRSFKMAGVDYLIMSLWQVPDKETSEFMTLFYTHLLKTKSIRGAFAKTQKTMRQKYDPYYWAAFVLIE